MKRLLLLLFIPILSYSQISYKDVMSINSVNMFKKVLIENSWRNTNYKKDKKLHYRWFNESGNINIDGWYYIEEGKFDFLFLDRQLGFDSIWDEIKKKCVFFDVIDDFVCYDCSQSKYKGVIGFKTMNESYWGVIEQFPIK